MQKLHVGCSPLTGTIFAGKILKDGRTWATGKEDVTIEALVAVSQHVVHFGRPVEISKADGTGIEYKITVEKVSEMKDKISEGDRVAVSFNCSQTTLIHDATVIYAPAGIGDSWVLKDNRTGWLHYVSEPCTLSKLDS